MTDEKPKKKAKQNPKDPHWLVRYKIVHSVTSNILKPDGTPFIATVDVGEEEMTVAAPDADAAKAFIEQQNPGIKIVAVDKSEVQP